MNSIPRRTFIKTGAAAATGAFVLPRFSIGQPGPSANSKLNVAMIGAGGFASMAYPSLATENIVALCDVDSNKLFQHAESIRSFDRPVPSVTSESCWTRWAASWTG